MYYFLKISSVLDRLHAVFWKGAKKRFFFSSEFGDSGSNAIRLTAAALTLVLAAPAWSQADILPKNPMNSQGVKVEAVVNKKMTILQKLPRVMLAWDSFNIGAANTVEFIQPNKSSVVLNRVAGREKSEINGKLQANGQVFLINPHGVLFGKTAQVDVGGLVASTLDISNEDFLRGRWQFSGQGSDVEGGEVINQGSISAGNGAGFVALLGARVSNQGTIAARLGSVALAAGNKLSLDFAGDGLLNVQVNEPALAALAENRQLIEADGGRVLLTAHATNALLQTVINNTGVIRARTVAHRLGKIELCGDFSGGISEVSGHFDVSARGEDDGGAIDINSSYVQIHPDAKASIWTDQGKVGAVRITSFGLSSADDLHKTASGIVADTLTPSPDASNAVLQPTGIDAEKSDLNVNAPMNRSRAH